MVGENERFVGENERFVGENERFVGENEAFVGENEAFVGENVRFVGENVRFVGENVRFVGENEAFVGENVRFVGENEGVVAQTRYEIAFRNAIALKIVFRLPCCALYSGRVLRRSRNAISRTSAFQSATLEREGFGRERCWNEKTWGQDTASLSEYYATGRLPFLQRLNQEFRNGWVTQIRSAGKGQFAGNTEGKALLLEFHAIVGGMGGISLIFAQFRWSLIRQVKRRIAGAYVLERRVHPNPFQH